MMNCNEPSPITGKKGLIFSVFSLLLLAVYAVHNPVRWEAFVNFPATFLLLRPYTLYGHLADLLILFWLGYIGHHFGRRHLAYAFDAPSAPWYITIPYGWGVLALLLFLAALLQKLQFRFLVLMMVGLTAIVSMDLFHRRIPFLARGKEGFISLGRTVRAYPADIKVALLLTGIAVGASFFSSLMPPTQSDGLRYHVTVPKLYLEHGGFYVIPDLAFSNFPFLIEYLFIVPLAFQSISGPKLIHFSYFVFTLFILYRLGKKLGGERSGWYAVLLFATTPFVPLFASWSFIECGLTCYILLGFLFLLEFIERMGESSARCYGWPGAVFAGFCVSCKYTALAVLAFLAAAPLGYALAAHRKRMGMALYWGFFIGGVGMLIASPWFIKNMYFFGNPLYPFGKSLFPTPGWSDFNALFFSYHAGLKGSLNAMQQSPIGERIADLLTLPIRITLYPGDREWHSESFGDWPVGALWLALLPFVLLQRCWTPRKALHFTFSLFLFLVWALTYRDTRFLLPAMAVAAPLFGGVAEELYRAWKHIRIPLFMITIYGLCSLLFRFYIPGTYAPWWVVSGETSVEDYLAWQSDFTRPTYQAFRYLEKNTARDDLVLLHGIERPFYCPNRYIGADFFDTDPLIRWAWENPDPHRLAETIRNQGIKYIVCYIGLIKNPSYAPLYRLFRLQENVGYAFLQEVYQNEPVRINYPYLYEQWSRDFETRLTQAESHAPHLSALEAVVEGRLFPEVYRFDRPERTPDETVVVYQVTE